MRSAVIIAVALAALTVPAHADTKVHPCLGRWTGSASNSGSQPWGIDLAISSVGADCGTIEYDSSQLDCGGTLERCTFGETNGTAQEDYSHNENCAPPGRLEFRCQGETMTWTWYGWENVTTRLTRVPGSAPQPSNDRSSMTDDTPSMQSGDTTMQPGTDMRASETPDQPAGSEARDDGGLCAAAPGRPSAWVVLLVLAAPAARRRRWAHRERRGQEHSRCGA